MATSWNRTHGESHTRLHNTWLGIIDRCRHHKGYGGRGISVCEEWKDYVTFREWALSNGYADNLTIERIDVNGDYCPGNCTWIPLEKQARNRRTTHWVEYNGERMSLAEACERANMPYKQVFARVKVHGWSFEKSISTPIKGKSELRKKCDQLGLNYHTVYNRIRMGWSEEEAINTPIEGLGANQTTYKHTA